MAFQHEHTDFTFGCFRCEIGLAEYRGILYDQVDEASVNGNDEELTAYLRELDRINAIEDGWHKRYRR